MDERSARRVRAVQAFDTACSDDHPMWTAEDRTWASRVAREQVGAQAPVQDFIVARADAATQRLAPRDERLARWLAARGSGLSGCRGLGALLLLAAVLGALAHGLGPLGYVDLLAPPVWALLLWNLLVYLGVGLKLLRGRLFSVSSAWPGGWRRWLARRAVVAAPVVQRKHESAAAYGLLASLWAADSAPLAAGRVARALHLAAAAMALGVVAGLYLRGLAFDYRAAWQSTFLEPAQVAQWLQLWLAPAAALSDVALPDAAGMAALRIAPGETARAAAAPWIHLYTVTVLLLVVLPRLLLALASGLRAGWRARRMVLDLDVAYVQALQRQQGHAAVQQARLLPHGLAPSAQAVLALREALAQQLGERLRFELLPEVPFGQEDGCALDAATLDGGLLVLGFDLTATPEAEHHGRLLQRVQQALQARPATARAQLMVLVDESAFVRRFEGDEERRSQRCEAWRTLLQGHGLRPLFAALELPAAPAQTGPAVQQWLQHETVASTALAAA